MRLGRVLAFLVLLVPAITGAEGKQQKVVADRIAAVVNDQVILVSELELRMVPLRQTVDEITNQVERDRRLAKLAQQTLDAMVDDELILQAGKAAKLTVEEKEIEATIEYIKKEHKLDDKQLVEAMKQQGITRATLRDDLLRQRTIANFVLPKVTVTDEEIKARYDSMQKRSAQVTAVNVSAIVLALPEHPTDQQTGDARRRAQAAIDRVKGGEAFEEVAKAVSEDDTTKTGGGMLGWLEAGTLDPAWESVVMGMEKGDLRGPITGTKGLYVLYANDVKRTTLQPFAQVKDSIASDLRRAQLAKLTKTWVEELRKKAYIEIKLL
jgi:peptidyl-prolyl cis-trans isomerase SurA